jgi:hypothetical protein
MARGSRSTAASRSFVFAVGGAKARYTDSPE